MFHDFLYNTLENLEMKEFTIVTMHFPLSFGLLMPLWSLKQKDLHRIHILGLDKELS